MIVTDVNLLLYAIDTGSPHHKPAAAWWTSALDGREAVGLPWATVLAFLRLTTNPRVFLRPLDPTQAMGLIEAWRGLRHVVPIDPTDRHLPLLHGLLDVAGTAGNLVTDAHLAAIAIEHGATLYSADADFGRFAGLRWRNPLADTKPT